jgi:hypothetical protein
MPTVLACGWRFLLETNAAFAARKVIELDEGLLTLGL